MAHPFDWVASHSKTLSQDSPSPVENSVRWEMIAMFKLRFETHAMDTSVFRFRGDISSFF